MAARQGRLEEAAEHLHLAIESIQDLRRRLHVEEFRTGFLEDSDWLKLHEAADYITNAPIFIDDTPALSTLELQARCRRLKAREDLAAVGKHLEVAGHFIHPDEASVPTLEIVAELARNGIPVYIQTPFLAGCNDDGAVDISDAVFSLGSLFLGDGAPSCDDACDSNDDGAVDISDAIATLGGLNIIAGELDR